MAINRENVIRSAEKYVAKGKLEAAIKQYRKLIKENPNEANTLNRVGDLYARIGRNDEAVRLFTQIAEQYTEDGFFVKAIAIYKKIIKLDPKSLQVYERLAELYHRQGLLNEARTQYQVLADYYQKHDNATSAITIYTRMAEMEPDNPSYRLRLAELYSSQRLNDKALGEYKSLADLMIVAGSVDEAVQVYEKAFELVPEDDLAFVREAVSNLRGAGHNAAAAQLLARAVDVFPEARSIAAEIGIGGAEAAPAKDETVEDAFDASEPDVFEIAPEEDEADPFSVPADAFSDLDDSIAAVAAVELEPIPEDDLGFELQAGDEAAVSFPPADEAVGADEDEFTFDLDLDLEGDELPSTLVQPPADLVEESVAAGSGEADGGDLVFELDLEDDAVPSTLVEPPDDMGPPRGASGEPEPEAIEEAGAIEVDALDELEEVDWAVSELDLELPAIVEEEASPVLEAEAVPAAEAAPEAVATPEEPAVAVRPEEDLMAEAKVFAKYGLRDKALDRLSELLAVNGDHLEGLALQLEMELDRLASEEIGARAKQVEELARRSGQVSVWKALEAVLLDSGFEFAPEPVAQDEPAPPSAAAPAPRRAKKGDRISQLLEDLSLEDFELPARRPSTASAVIVLPPKAVEPSPAETPVVGVESELAGRDAAEPVAAVEAPPADEPLVREPDMIDLVTDIGAELEAEAGLEAAAGAEAPPSAEPVPVPAAADRIVDLADELGLDELEDELEGVLPTPPSVAAASSAPAPEAAIDDTGIGWLDEVVPEAGAEAVVEDSLFDDEDDFFDLASELERELSEDELAEIGAATAQPQEQSLEEIIEGFKQGVAENLSPEDYETHFNLGIAYREMGLLDEAIGEFQLASKDSRYVVECASMLGMCFIEKGLPELAVRWYRKGLESPHIPEETTLGLLYDMGEAYESTGDTASAYKTFVEVYGMNTNYREVSAKLRDLKASASN